MSFLAPLFFLALAGLAIPVLLHLTQREKKQIVRFPSLMFVRRIPYQSVRRRKIQHWLLLCIRLAALAVIVLAFARPFFERPDAAAAGTGAREVVILLDTSYSMGYGDRWERARAAAHAEIGRLGASDRASIVLFSSGAEIALRSAAESERLAAAVAEARPSASSTRYAPALKVAGSILAESPLPRREVVLISDFQRGGWRGEEGARLPDGAVLTPVPIQTPADRPNVSVTAVSLARSTFANQERVTVTAGVTNRSERPVSGSTITLEVSGLPIATRPLDLEPGASGSVVFDPFTVSGRNMRATVRLADDALAADNTFNFVVSPSEALRVTMVDRGAGASGLYLSRALAVSDAPRVDLTTRQPDAVSDDDLRRSAVVILNDVPVPASLARRLARFVEQGGGLIVAAGARASWPAEVDLLPGSIGAPEDRTREPARVGVLDFAHPIFEPFRTPRSGDFATVPVYAYRTIAPAPAALVLARFDAGPPAVLERRVGNGRVVLWGSTLDVSWTDLPTRALFVPFVHRAVRHVAAYSDPQPWLQVGQVLDPAGATPRARTSSEVVTPSGRRVPLADEGAEVLELMEQGFYELRGADGQAVAVVAANVDPAEADLTPMDPREIVAAAAAGSGTAGGGAASSVPLTPEAQERSQRLWWYLLLAGILLLGVDTVVSNRMAKS
ncbi:MAG TPA: BatA domain-containing protein [Vicinamibacterales bacterium]|nr:BatA domain-containing protein [Vicinamibacterales bacterium]